jgi:hypothetical protein
MLDLGVLLWVSPYGYRYRRDANGTTDLTSGPVPAPQRPAEPPDE